jgi:uncharacterized protein
MDRSDRERLTTIAARVSSICGGHDPAHDFAHVRRVIANAETILQAEDPHGETCDIFAVLAACWLHDLVQLPKGSGPPGESARRSADESRRLLAELGIAVDRIELVCAAIRTHSYSGGEQPTSLEGKIVQDADRLDALGAIGLARLFAVAATLGSQLYDPDDPLAAKRPLDDKRFALDHIAAKLLKLPQLMHTQTARRLAESRIAFVEAFREQMVGEVRNRLPGIGDWE